MLHGILSGAAWFAVFLAIHMFWFHLVHVKDCFKAIMKVFTACLIAHAAAICVTASNTVTGGDIAARICYGALTMCCLFILYMPFYYTIVASLSIQTLIYIEHMPRKSASLPALRKRFASRDIVEGRLTTMVSNGYLSQHERGYRVTGKGHMVAHCFLFIKAIWRLGPGG
jgi:hypothetical protein